MLRALRREDTDRTLWIDAICINQGDLAERSEQVALMARVYRSAKTVVVWLGPEADDSSLALETLDAISQNVTLDGSEGTVELSYTAANNPFLMETSPIAPLDARTLIAIHDLLHRPWFERLWVRQEIRLAHAAMVECGRAGISWDSFKKALACLGNTELDYELLGYRTESMLSRRSLVVDLCRSDYSAIDYDTLRYTLRELSWSGPRDAVFATLSMMHETHASLGVRADYARGTAEIYRDVVERLARSGQDMSVLATCELASKSIEALPTWVPDWSTPILPASPITSFWHAAAWTTPRAEYLGGGVLQMMGLRIATIKDTRMCPRGFFVDSILSQIRKLRPAGSLDGEYAGGGTLLDAYTDFVCLAQYSDLEDPPRPDWPTPSDAAAMLADIWNNRPLEELEDAYTEVLGGYTSRFSDLYGRRCFFTTEEGYFGLGPRGVRAGDQVCVLLGCHAPLTLRPASSSSREIVGACCVQGIMQGEAITGRWPSHLRPLFHSHDHLASIDDRQVAVKDTLTKEIITDPAEVLRRLGIRGAEYQRSPHRLIIADEALGAAGVKLEEFRLV